MFSMGWGVLAETILILRAWIASFFIKNKSHRCRYNFVSN